MPLRFGHSREGRIVVDAGIVDKNIDSTFREHCIDRRVRCVGFGHIEGYRFRIAADVIGQISRAIRIGIRMDIDEMSLRRERAADGAADIAAAAGDERAALFRSRGHAHILARCALTRRRMPCPNR